MATASTSKRSSRPPSSPGSGTVTWTSMQKETHYGPTVHRTSDNGATASRHRSTSTSTASCPVDTRSWSTPSVPSSTTSSMCTTSKTTRPSKLSTTTCGSTTTNTRSSAKRLTPRTGVARSSLSATVPRWLSRITASPTSSPTTRNTTTMPPTASTMPMHSSTAASPRSATA